VCYKRHPSHLTELHALKMYNLVYASNDMQKKSEANIGVTNANPMEILTLPTTV
jgi:hypothetical protein